MKSTAVLLISLSFVGSLSAMELSKEQLSPQAVITWGAPITKADPAHDQTILTAFKESLLQSSVGVARLRQHLEDRPASASNVEGLDLACSDQTRQNAIKIAALLAARGSSHHKGYVLKETTCSKQALMNWRAQLSQKLMLCNQGWTQEQDAAFAQKILQTTNFALHLKNQFLTNNELSRERVKVRNCHKIISPDYQYALISDENPRSRSCSLYDVATGEILETFENIVISVGSNTRFCKDTTLCILSGGKPLTTDYNPALESVEIAYDIKSRKLIETPAQFITKTFSPTGRFAIVSPDTVTSVRRALFDTHTQEIIVKFPEMCSWATHLSSFSPNENYCFLNTKEGLKLYDLTRNGEEISLDPCPDYGVNNSEIKWAPDSSCCLIPQFGKCYHSADSQVCFNKSKPCVQGDFCEHGDKKTSSSYFLYFPLTNTHVVLDGVMQTHSASFSKDSRVCYISLADHKGLIFDLKACTPVRIFEKVIDKDEFGEDLPAFFSQDPEFPYCFIPTVTCDTAVSPKVVGYNYATHKDIPEISKLTGTLSVLFPEKTPYYIVCYFNPCPPEYRSQSLASIDLRNKKTHSLILHSLGCSFALWSNDGAYCVIDSSDGRTSLYDLVNQEFIRPCSIDNIGMLDDGRIFDSTWDQGIIEIAPANCDWSKTSSQQLYFIMYALEMCKEDKPLDLTIQSNMPLKSLYESLDFYMKDYVSRACKIRVTP